MPISSSVSKFIKQHTLTNASAQLSRQELQKGNFIALSPKGVIASQKLSLLQKNAPKIPKQPPNGKPQVKTNVVAIDA